MRRFNFWHFHQFCISQYRKGLPSARGPLRCGAQFGLIGQIGLKPALYLAKVTERMNQNCNASLDSGRHLIAAENTTRPLENTFLNDSSLGVSISQSGAVTKLPAFLESNLTMWLALLDSHSQTTQILGESVKI